MKSQILIRRYTQGLANALSGEGEFELVRKELGEFLKLRAEDVRLDKFLTSPFVTTGQKMQAVREILGTSGVSKKTERLILLLLEHGRLNLLGAICGLFPILWNEKKGVSSFEVRSAVPLTEEQREALKARLEEMEKRSVSLSFRIDPEIIGGLYLRRGNIVYDASIRGSLAGLMEKMTEG